VLLLAVVGVITNNLKGIATSPCHDDDELNCSGDSLNRQQGGVPVLPKSLYLFF